MSVRLRLGQLPGPLRRRRARPFVARVSRVLTGIDRRRAHRGRTTFGGWIGAAPVLLLTTTGRRSGLRRTTPLLYHRDADRSLLLVAANGAADWNPDWFHNLVADPHVDVDLDGESLPANATVLDDEQRAEAWPVALRAFPGLALTQRASRRAVPLVRLRAKTAHVATNNPTANNPRMNQ
jgi:deazaflavin-dependent oxidoreductase (nitroreductase family)